MFRKFVRGALALVIWVAILLGLQALLHGRLPDAIAQIIIALALLFTYWAVERWVERRAASELRFRDTAWLLYGIIAGLVLFVCTMVILAISGVYSLRGFVSAQPLVSGLMIAFLAAVAEEVLFRGFIFRWIERGIGTWNAVAVSALLFGLAHVANRGATPVSTAAIALEAGVLLSAAYVFSRTLWLPIGIHLGWNFTEGTIFGVDVSGHHAPGLLLGALHGPVFLAGGDFGVEASLPAVAVCLAAAAVLLAFSVRRGHMIQPIWRRARIST